MIDVVTVVGIAVWVIFIVVDWRIMVKSREHIDVSGEYLEQACRLIELARSYKKTEQRDEDSE
jgi:hypothetical protein